MNRVSVAGMAISLVLSLGASGWCQGMRGGMGPQAPHLLGEFKPVVGAGAQYQLTTQNRTLSFVYAIVGKENVEGGTGYWMEIRTENPEMPGETVMKQLVVTEDGTTQIKRMIMQTPGRPPMEMPTGLMQDMQQSGSPRVSSDSSPGEKVGSETVIVPAGTFVCDHYRKPGPRGVTDVWVSSKVPPYGTVKMSNAGMTMMLQKVLTNETSHIQGEPQRINMPPRY
jgi:hypothetical protein